MKRASLIDPLNDDLRANMLLADLRAIDKIEPLPQVAELIRCWLYFLQVSFMEFGAYLAL